MSYWVLTVSIVSLGFFRYWSIPCLWRNNLAMFTLKWLLPFLLLFKLPLANTAPGSNCYAVDKNDYIYDFTKLVGKKFEYEGKNSDLAVRFCKDVQDRSDSGYVDFGHFEPSNYFAPGTGNADFVQKYYFGDLQHCEQHGFDKMGRSAQVSP